MRVACLFFIAPAPLQDIAECALQWTPQIAVGEEAIFLEIGKCRQLFDESFLYLQLEQLTQKFESPARIAFADDLPTALALARYSKASKAELPIEALQDYVSPFQKNSSLLEALSQLRKLGLARVEDFTRLPPKLLVQRFGAAAFLAHTRLQGASQILWPRFAPAEKIVERREVESSQPVVNVEMILFLIKSVVDRAMERLRGRGEALSVLEFTIEQEKYSFIKEARRSWKIPLSFAQTSSTSVIHVLKERLERDLQRHPLEAPAVSVEFQVLEAVPGGFSQKDFFSKKEEEYEAYASLLSRLCERLGASACFKASLRESYKPEGGWTKSTEISTAGVSLSERPLRLFPQPLRVQRSGEYLVHPSRKWKVSAIDGPERLMGEWWSEGFQRDYYRIATQEGEDIWVFKDLTSDEFYLHGVFD